MIGVWTKDVLLFKSLERNEITDVSYKIFSNWGSNDCTCIFTK